MKKIIILLFISQLNLTSVESQTTIYVSNLGPVKTLKEAYDLITSPGTVTYNIILKNDGGDILIAPPGNCSNESCLKIDWKMSGTAAHPINIFSENCFTNLTRQNKINGPVMIRLIGADYINFSNIHFHNAIMGTVLFDHSSHCSINFCKFSGDSPVNPVHGGVIWIGDQPCNQPSLFSRFNTISNNIFFSMLVNNSSNKNEHQAIYLSSEAYNNTIYNNTIIEPPGCAILAQHSDYKYNAVAYNLCTQKNPPDQSAAMIMGFQTDAGCINNPVSVNNNSFYNNYVFDTENGPVKIYDEIDDGSLHNSQSGNARYYNQYPNDPYWLGYGPSQISNRMVVGDFNGDSFKDDIAAFYDYGNGSTRIHVWKTDPVSLKAFVYDNGSAGWWQSTEYTASQITGRVVSGDFNGDGKTDIAAFYDYGNSNTKLHVFLSSGNSFNYQTSTGWWQGTGYAASQITNRVVAGDFNKDGKCDIAAFYDYGNGNIKLHVWLSTGHSFNYQTSAGWWQANGYTASQITNRIVAGDFNKDGRSDIAAFYDYGNSTTKLHVWLSTGSNFNYQGSSGWWQTSGYNASQITNRVVAGDFNKDGKSDIAAFYDYSNGNTKLHVWLSTSNGFNYQGPTGWWSVSDGSYNVNKIIGRLVAGDFDKDGNCNEIAGFFDYTAACGSVRSHVWQQTGSIFNFVNSSLGYPWLTQTKYANAKNIIKPLPKQVIDSGSDISIYPNPAMDKIIIEMQRTAIKSSLSICNTSGQEVIKKQMIENKTEIDISYLTGGMYFIKIVNGNSIMVKKIIKE